MGHVGPCEPNMAATIDQSGSRNKIAPLLIIGLFIYNINKCTLVITMVRYCAVKGCNVKEKQGVILFRFPKEPERRAKWITMVNRVNWQPHANSTLCELHFSEDQWEQKRIDGSRKLRCSAIPSLLPSKENSLLAPHISFIDKHNYCLSSVPATISHQSQSPLKGITNVNMNNIPISPATFATSVNLIKKMSAHKIHSSVSSSVKKTMEEESVKEKSVEKKSVEKEFVEESVDLKQQLELKEKELAALQTKHISMQKITDRVFKSYCNIKSCGVFAEKLHEDQWKALCSKTTRGRKWSIQSITDGLIYKMKWGTQNYSDFIKKYPIFPSVRTLQKVEHMKLNI